MSLANVSRDLCIERVTDVVHSLLPPSASREPQQPPTINDLDPAAVKTMQAISDQVEVFPKDTEGNRKARRNQ